MSTPRGYSSQEKEDRLSAQFQTVEPIRELQFGSSVVAHQFVYEVGTDATEAGTTADTIVASSHAALKGDIIRLTSGALAGYEAKVWSVETNSIELAETLPEAPAAAVSFQILRHKYPLVESTGEVKVSGVFSEVATAADGGALPGVVKVAGGYDGSAVQVLKTDASGELQIDVLSSALPAGAATEATLATIATEATVSTLATEATVATLATEATVATLATEATVSILATEATVSTLATEATVSTLATEATVLTLATEATVSTLATEATVSTLATEATVSTLGTETTLDAVKTAVELLDNAVSGNELQVDVVTSALPTGAATEATLASIEVDTSALAGCVAGTEVQVDVVAALPSGTNTIGKIDVNTLSVVDLLDAGILDTSSTNIAGSASNPTEVVASTAAAVKKLQILDTTGAFIGLYTGAALSEVLQLVIGPGSDQTIDHSISAGTRISLKRLDSATAISSGIVAINLIG